MVDHQSLLIPSLLSALHAQTDDKGMLIFWTIMSIIFMAIIIASLVIEYRDNKKNTHKKKMAIL